MLLNAAVLILLGVMMRQLWSMSGFMQGRAKSGRIFFLTSVSGLCLITNVVFPFLIASAIVTVLELRGLIVQT